MSTHKSVANQGSLPKPGVWGLYQGSVTQAGLTDCATDLSLQSFQNLMDQGSSFHMAQGPHHRSYCQHRTCDVVVDPQVNKDSYQLGYSKSLEFTAQEPGQAPNLFFRVCSVQTNQMLNLPLTALGQPGNDFWQVPSQFSRRAL